MDYRKHTKLLKLTPKLISCTSVKIYTDFYVKTVGMKNGLQEAYETS
jgi:hypothetical protein